MAGEFDAAISTSETALALNSNLALAHFRLGSSLLYSGRYGESIVELDEAIRLSPRDPMLTHTLMVKAMATLLTERYEEGLGLARSAQSQPNAHIWAFLVEVVALSYLDRTEEANRALERVRAIKPDFSLNFVDSTRRQVHFVGREFFIEGLKKVGLEN